MAVLKLSSADQYLTVTADTPLLEVYQALPAGLFPPFAPLELPGGVGGLVARGGFGQNFFFSSEILGLRFRTPAGNVVQAGGITVKNVQGFDLVRPFVGSFGKLGMALEVTLRLRPGRAALQLSKEGTLESVRDLEPRFMWQDGETVHAFSFGHPRALDHFEREFGGKRVEDRLDYRSRFPDGMGVGEHRGEGEIRDSRVSWKNGSSTPELPLLFARVVAALS